MFGFLAPLLGKLGGSAIAGTLVQTGLGALQARSERKAAQRDQANQFVQLKDAALRAGFNPLTALQSTGGAGFGGLPSGVPPLASVQALAGAITDATARNSDGSAVRQGVGGLHKIAADNLGAATARGRVSLAGRTAEAMPLAVRPATSHSAIPARDGGLSPYARAAVGDLYESENMPVGRGAGLTVINNALTAGEDVLVPGADGEPWGIDEVATAASAFGVHAAMDALRGAADGATVSSGPFRRAGSILADFGVPVFQQVRHHSRLSAIAERRIRRSAEYNARREETRRALASEQDWPWSDPLRN